MFNNAPRYRSFIGHPSSVTSVRTGATFPRGGRLWCLRLTDCSKRQIKIFCYSTVFCLCSQPEMGKFFIYFCPDVLPAVDTCTQRKNNPKVSITPFFEGKPPENHRFIFLNFYQKVVNTPVFTEKHRSKIIKNFKKVIDILNFYAIV